MRRVVGLTSVLLLALTANGSAATQEQTQGATGAAVAIPEAYKVVITGRLLNQESKPLAGMSVMVCEAILDMEKKTLSCPWKTGPGGKLANPQAMTDAQGKFTIVADRRFWQEAGKFTLRSGFLPGTTRSAGFLRGPGGVVMTLAVDKRTKNVNVGDIIVTSEEK